MMAERCDQLEGLGRHISQRIHRAFRERVRTREEALRREFRAHGWREWIEVEEQYSYLFAAAGDLPQWQVIRRQPRGLWGWLRHKFWALKVQVAIWRAGMNESDNSSLNP